MILLLLLLSLPARADDFPPSDLAKMLCPFNAGFTRKNVDQELLEHGGLEELKAALEELRSQFGPCTEVRALGGKDYELHYREASVPLEVIQAGKRVRSFFLGMPEIRNDTPAKVLAAVKKETVETAYYAGTEGGRELVAYRADEPLSISRSNQIFLLRAARDAKIPLGDTVALDEKAAVHSYGILHTWKPGTLLTIDSLLQLLVSEKDLTASDLLLARLGGAAVASYGKSLAPFLSFREYYLLSASALPKDRAAVTALLPTLVGKAAPQSAVPDRPELRKILGWFASPRELCASALAVKDEIIARNKQLNGEYLSVQPKNVEAFGLVQTRDSGVSQLTQVFKIKGQSEWRCLSITANAAGEIEEGFFSSIAARLSRLSVKD